MISRWDTCYGTDRPHPPFRRNGFEFCPVEGETRRRRRREKERERGVVIASAGSTFGG